MTTLTPTVADVTFNEEDHSYWLGMARIPSVSELLRPLTDGYLASIPEGILNWKRDLGIAVHKACELYDLGTLDEGALDERITPYLDGYKSFIVDHQPQWQGIEQIVCEPGAGYAGTLDRIGKLRAPNGPTIIDIKTSVKVQPTAGLQLWAYQLAQNTYEAPDLAVLQLLPTGKYALVMFTQYGRYAATWDALLALYQWKQETK